MLKESNPFENYDKLPNNINVETEYGDDIVKIWQEGSPTLSEVVSRGYAIEKMIPKNAILFLSMNPSYKEGVSGGGFADIYKSEHPFHVAIQDFYISISEPKPPMAHHDLLFLMETSQKNVLKWKEQDKVFFDKQLKISKEIIEKAEPKMIVVINAGASKLFQDHFKDSWSSFDDDLGVDMYKIDKNITPVLFSGMLSGQRALDIGSRDSLKWHIEYILKKLKKSHN